MSNKDFFESFALTGTIGLVGGTAFIDRSIKKAQEKITPDLNPSPFSHAFLISGKREDDRIWLLESDLDFHHRHIKIGIQENRIEKYYDEKLFPNVAIMNFDLNSDQQKAVVAEGLNLLSGKGQYSIREIFGVVLSLRQQNRRHTNVFSRNNSFFCSAFVQHCYEKAGIWFNEDISLKHMTPSDIFHSKAPHKIQSLIREHSE